MLKQLQLVNKLQDLASIDAQYYGLNFEFQSDNELRIYLNGTWFGRWEDEIPVVLCDLLKDFGCEFDYEDYMSIWVKM